MDLGKSYKRVHQDLIGLHHAHGSARLCRNSASNL